MVVCGSNATHNTGLSVMWQISRAGVFGSIMEVARRKKRMRKLVTMAPTKSMRAYNKVFIILKNKKAKCSFLIIIVLV